MEILLREQCEHLQGATTVFQMIIFKMHQRQKSEQIQDHMLFFLVGIAVSSLLLAD